RALAGRVRPVRAPVAGGHVPDRGAGGARLRRPGRRQPRRRHPRAGDGRDGRPRRAGRSGGARRGPRQAARRSRAARADGRGGGARRARALLARAGGRRLPGALLLARRGGRRGGGGRAVLTLFSVPKPFRGRIGDNQRAALASWVALGPDVQVVVLGDEQGAAEAARAAGAEHVGEVGRTARGTPRLDAALAAVDAVARHPRRALVNADVLLLASAQAVALAAPRFLLVGETLDVDEPVTREQARRLGSPRGVAALDWFVFPAGLYPEVPPFALGRACFDNWLVWQARRRGIVVDASHDVVAAHLRHGYDHLAGGK